MAVTRRIEKGSSRRDLLPGGWGSEEDAVLAEVPDSPRLRRLLADLEIIMHTEGFLHAGTDDLARRLRCSKATLYRLAQSRESLFELVISRWLARVRDEGWKRVDGTEDWSQRLVDYCSASVDLMEDCHSSYAFWRDMNNFPGGYRLLMAHQKQRIDGLERIVTQGIEAGAFRQVHPRLVSEFMLMCVRQIVEPDFTASVGLSVTDAVDEWYRIIEYGLIRRPSEPIIDSGTPNGRHRRRAVPTP